MTSPPVPIPAPTAAAIQFTHQGELLWIGVQFATAALPFVLLTTGLGARLATALARVARGRRWLSLTLFAWIYVILQTVILLPLRYVDQVGRWAQWAAAGFPTNSAGTWLVGQAVLLLGLMAAAAALLWIPFRLIERSPKWWAALLTALVVPALAMTLVIWQVVVVPTTTHFQPLNDKGLASGIEAIAHRCGAGTVPILVGGNDNTVVGLGPTSRILIAPWALKMQTRPELLTTIAHELKHYRMGDNWFALAVVGILISAGFFLIQAVGAFVLRSRDGRFGIRALHEPAALPLMILILLVSWDLAGLPIFNAVQRHVEHEADRFALETTHDNHAFSQWQAYMLPWRVARDDWFTRVFLDNHPSQAERIQFGNKYMPWIQGRPGHYGRVCNADGGKLRAYGRPS